MRLGKTARRHVHDAVLSRSLLPGQLLCRQVSPCIAEGDPVAQLASSDVALRPGTSPRLASAAEDTQSFSGARPMHRAEGVYLVIGSARLIYSKRGREQFVVNACYAG